MRRFIAIAFAFAVFSVAARADVIYNFTGTSLLSGTTFIVQTPSYLSYSFTPVAASGGELVFMGTDFGAVAQVNFYQLANLSIATANNQRVVSFSLLYDLKTPGTYTGDLGKLVVSNNTVTPEPSSLVLLGTGVFGVIGAFRRRLHS